MTAPALFNALTEQLRSGGRTAVLDHLAEILIEQKDYHKLFDARCQRKKYELELPLHQPTSFSDVPDDKRQEFESAYMAAAREVGQYLLADKKLGHAWMYFNAIHETESLKEAIEQRPIPSEASDESEELIDVALYKLVHPVKGIQVLLRTHGTCKTITSLDQQFRNLSPDQRSECAAILVRTLHKDLFHSVQSEVAKRLTVVSPVDTLRELIAGRDWLFADNNYHLDVSHLHSTVRFARSLRLNSPELALARDLAEYGLRLAPQFQYAGEPPFTDFYSAHINFFKFLSGEDSDAAWDYFQQQINSVQEESEQTLIAIVLVDLLSRTSQIEKALPFAEKFLLGPNPDFVVEFSEMCQKTKRIDVLRSAAEARGDLVTFAAALVQLI